MLAAINRMNVRIASYHSSAPAVSAAAVGSARKVAYRDAVSSTSERCGCDAQFEDVVCRSVARDGRTRSCLLFACGERGLAIIH